MKTPYVTLSGQYKIPQIGLGLWKIRQPSEFLTAFEAAIHAGYRHFDGAQAYGNEHLLGAAWQKSGLAREDFFLTTKIAVQNFGYHKAKRTFAESLKRLQTDYVDLLLLHFPLPVLRKKSWHALEDIQADGGARSIGVSNYMINHLEDIRKYAKVMPAVNQVELHVFLQQPELVKYCRDHNIVVEAYSPLAHNHGLDDPVLATIAKKHGKTPAQIMLRWCLQQNLITLPKSVTPARIRENIDVFDFQLDTQDQSVIIKLDRKLRTAWNPTHVP